MQQAEAGSDVLTQLRRSHDHVYRPMETCENPMWENWGWKEGWRVNCGTNHEHALYSKLTEEAKKSHSDETHLYEWV